jgi:hypothetical protein
LSATEGSLAIPAFWSAHTNGSQEVGGSIDSLSSAKASICGVRVSQALIFTLPSLLAQDGAHLGPHLLSNAGTLQVIAERIVDEGLIITAMCFSNKFAEVIDNIAVEPSG